VHKDVQRKIQDEMEEVLDRENVLWEDREK
jgi:hypothetical protein